MIIIRLIQINNTIINNNTRINSVFCILRTVNLLLPTPILSVEEFYWNILLHCVLFSQYPFILVHIFFVLSAVMYLLNKSIICYYKMMKQPFIISFSLYQSVFTLSCFDMV